MAKPQHCKTAQDANQRLSSITNVCITTYGMSGTVTNRWGYPELAIQGGRYHMIFNDEEQNAFDEKQFVLPSFLKPHVGVIVSLQDQAQTPPHTPSLLRQKNKPNQA
eukprot:6697717-Karenia_brevis.AAC.1